MKLRAAQPQLGVRNKQTLVVVAREQACAMAYIFCSTGQCPPENTPLVSTRDELAQDVAKIEHWRTVWSQTFPGRAASFDEKLAWWAKCAEIDFDDWRGRPEAADVLPSILYDAVDDAVELQLVVKRSRARALADLDAARGAKFLASAERARGEPLRQRALNKVRSTAKGLAAYAEWLATEAPACEMRPRVTPAKPLFELPGSPPHDPTPYDEVVIASLSVRKDDDMGEMLQSFFEKCGVQGSMLAMSYGSDESTHASGYGFGDRDRVGDHFFYVDKRGKCCVGVEFIPGAVPSQDDDAPEPLAAELDGLAKRHPDMVCLRVPADGREPSSDDDDEAATPRDLVLWLPKSYVEEKKRASAHIKYGEGERAHRDG